MCVALEVGIFMLIICMGGDNLKFGQDCTLLCTLSVLNYCLNILTLCSM
jgi:hypothetical protein